MHPIRVEGLVDGVVVQRPDHLALVFGDRCWTYAALRAEMDRRAALLVEAGLQPGDIIATTEATSDDLAISFLACCRADLSLLYLSPKLTIAEHTPLLRRSPVNAVLTADGRPHPARAATLSLPLSLPGTTNAASAREAARRSSAGSPHAISAILATSGTTGNGSKLTRTPHRNLTWRRATPEWWETADDTYYIPRPTLFAPRGLCVALMVGGTTIFSNATDPERIESEMAAHRATVLWTVPALLRLLAERTQPPPAGLALRAIRTGGSPLPPEVARAVACRYRAPIVQGYASTEGGGLMGTPPDGAPEGSIGKPYPGVAARIVGADEIEASDGAVGELIVRSPGIMCGYLGDPEASEQALREGWLWTGDLARRDADGFYYLEGRRTLRINVGGFKVAPEEVEMVLEQHPGVREAVVLAIPDAARGEVVRAVIIAQGQQPTIGELRRWCLGRLAGYKVPRRWEFREELPRSPLGKVLRHLL